MDEILPGLFIGDFADAQTPFDGFIFNVLENPPEMKMYRYPENVGWIPILRYRQTEFGVEVYADPGALDSAAINIAAALVSHKRVLVHCGGGIERSPLAVAWFLVTQWGYTMDDAYRLIASKRPQVQRRDYWIKG